MHLRKTGTKLIKPFGSEKAVKGSIPSSAPASVYPDIFFFTGSIEIIRLSLLDYFLKTTLLDGFISLTFRRLNSLVMAVAMDPKPRRLIRNVVMRFRNQKVKNLLRIEINICYLPAGRSVW